MSKTMPGDKPDTLDWMGEVISPLGSPHRRHWCPMHRRGGGRSPLVGGDRPAVQHHPFPPLPGRLASKHRRQRCQARRHISPHRQDRLQCLVSSFRMSCAAPASAPTIWSWSPYPHHGRVHLPHHRHHWFGSLPRRRLPVDLLGGGEWL